MAFVSLKTVINLRAGHSASHTHLQHKHVSYIELYDPEQGDEQEVKGDKEAEGPPHVRDALLLPGFVRLHPRADGRGADGPRPPAGQP